MNWKGDGIASRTVLLIAAGIALLILAVWLWRSFLLGLLMLVLWTLAVAAGVFLGWLAIAAAQRSGLARGRGCPKTPLDIAAERYARGEITREQYQQMKDDLKG